MKKISQATVVGQQGINLIEALTLKMNFVWNPTNIEAGIDGYIEIREAVTGQVTNCILQVQSKATDQPFENETENSFEFRCARKDLDYWLAGNAPVILVRSRPRTEEAYWVSVKDYFRDVETRSKGKVVFDKAKDRFDASARTALQRLATPLDSGFYLGTTPKPELIYSNLLRLAPLPQRYYSALTEYRTAAEVFARLREVTTNVRGDWILSDKSMVSFHDLRDHPWTEFCEVGTCEERPMRDWENIVDPARQRLFVRLLNACLKESLFPRGIKFSKEHGFYYFRASRDLSDREYAYQSRENKTSRVVFKGYPKRSDHTQMSFYRHSAFEGQFVRHGTEWYLEITPNYHFTKDGERTSRYASDLLSGIKRLENNEAVHGQVVMWAMALTERNLFDSSQRFVDFTDLLSFQLDVGLNDESWLKREEGDKRKTLESAADLGQQSFL